MAKNQSVHGQDRRAFLRGLAGTGGSFLLMSGIGALMGQSISNWKNQIGLELYTVRALPAKDFEGTIAKVAGIGYKEVEPVGYGGLDPKQFRALLDRHGLSAPSTHAGVTSGSDLEKQLEGQQVMGHKYTEVHAAQPGAPRAPASKRGPALPKRETEEAVKRAAAQLNHDGKLTQKFGMKILVHNHTQEFERLEGSGTQRPYDILLAETDPALVAMQLDIGWASVAGQNIVEMFEKNPGRFELWHVKDASGLKHMDAALTPNQRRQSSKLVPVGQGDVDYKAIFAKAELAGLKHFCIEQDNAAESGDSVAAARTSYDNLKRILT